MGDDASGAADIDMRGSDSGDEQTTTARGRGDGAATLAWNRRKTNRSTQARALHSRQSAAPGRSAARAAEQNPAVEEDGDRGTEAREVAGPGMRSEEEETRGRKILEAMEEEGLIRLSLTPAQCRQDIENIRRIVRRTTTGYISDTVTESSADSYP